MFKRVAQKIRSTLVSGREEMVSPTVVSRSFLDSFEKMAPATSQVRGLLSSHTYMYNVHVHVHATYMYNVHVFLDLMPCLNYYHSTIFGVWS